MPVNTEHADYKRMKPVWKKMRDVCGGQRAIHAAGEAYLPKLDNETPEQYEARLKRSSFFNATWRTVAGLKGMLFRVAPKTVISKAVEKLLDDVTKSGVNFHAFAKSVALECLQVGRVGVLVDYPAVVVDGLTVAQVEAMNLRPHMAMYKAESIINWATAWINNRTVLSKVVLSENVVLPGKDEFDQKTEERYRVLDLAPRDSDTPGEPPTLAYRIRTFKRNANGEDVKLSEMFPKMNGRPIPFIPFQFFGSDDTIPTVDEPPLIDLAEVNLSHYLSTSDRKHGAHKTAMPQPWITGIAPAIGPNGQPAAQKFYIGGGDAWAFPNPDTQVGMLEYTGQGLTTLKEEIEREEMQMAVLGARMLEAQKKGVETAEAAGIHRAGEQSALADQADTLSAGFKMVLSWFDQWGGGDGNVECEINKEFFPASLTPEELTAQVQAWQNGALSKQELFENLKSGGKIRPSTDFEQHEADIVNTQPTLSPGAVVPQATAVA